MKNKLKGLKKTYAKKGTILGLVLDIFKGRSEVSKFASEVNECKSRVNEVFKKYLFQREGQAGKFPLEFQLNSQPLDSHRTKERGEHGAVEI